MKENRLRHIFAEDNRTVIVAFDHAGFMGPVLGLENPGEFIESIVPTGIDAVLTTMGIARQFSDKLGRLGLILRADGGSSIRSPVRGEIGLPFSVEDALRLGADAVVCMGMIGFDEEPSSLRNLAELSSQSAIWNMPLLAEMLVKGPDKGSPSVKDIEFAMRIGIELGADFLKVPYAGPAEDFTTAIKGCYKPVVVLGGSKKDDPAGLLENVAEAIDSGSNGVAIGRNIWQHPDPPGMCRALVSIVHGGASVSQALKEIKL